MLIHRLRLLLLSIVISSLADASDSITLKNGNLLTGNIVNSDQAKVLMLSHPQAKELLKVREDAIERVVFQENTTKTTSETTKIKLTNGDNFPCSVTELTDDSVTFTSTSVGTHTVSRKDISSIKFNTKANKTLYTGPGDDITAWSRTSDEWNLDNGKLSTSQKTDASLAIPNLTDNYIIEFKTSWEQNSTHLRVYFSSDKSVPDKKSDFYYIELNSHGIIICHSILGNNKTLTQILADNNNLYAQSQLKIAIRVDRKHQKLALYINNKLIKTVSEKEMPPKGNYLILKNLQRRGIRTEISDIKVSSWSGKIHTANTPKTVTLAKHDIITDLSGNIMTGKIINLSKKDTLNSLNFKAPFAKKDSIIAENAIDLLEFQVAENTPLLPKPNYHLHLSSGGLLSFSSSQMIKDKLTIEHPILGNLAVPRANLTSIVTVISPPE